MSATFVVMVKLEVVLAFQLRHNYKLAESMSYCRTFVKCEVGQLFFFKNSDPNYDHILLMELTSDFSRESGDEE